METKKGDWAVYWQIGFYLTYEEWKLMLSSVRTVSSFVFILPMRNGNEELVLGNAGVDPFLSYL